MFLVLRKKVSSLLLLMLGDDNSWMLPFSLQQVLGLENLHYISISHTQNISNWVLEESGVLTQKAAQKFCQSLISSVAWGSLIC